MREAAIEFFATGFYSGYMPKAPGTWGSWLAACLAVLFAQISLSPVLLFSALSLIFLVLGVVASGAYAELVGDSDPSVVVIDEIAGQFLVYTLVPMSWATFLIGFALFRLFDIVKPWPANSLENLPGGWGIMLDDIVAGIMGAVVLYLLQIFVLA